MAVATELVQLAREQGDNKTAYLAVIPVAQRSSSPEAVPIATFRLVVASSRCSVADAVKRAVRCNVPVGELRDDRGGAAVVDGMFQLLVGKVVAGQHPTLRQEVAREAKKAVAHVRGTTNNRFAEEGEEIVDVEFWLVVILDEDSSEPGTEEEEEEVGSDLESDEACWQRGASDGDHWQGVHDDDDEAVLGGGAADGQFAARHYEGPQREEGGEPSVTTLLMPGYEVHVDGPELDVRSETTPRDMRHILRLALQGGDLTADPAYKQAFHGDTSVTPVPLAEILRQTLEPITPRQPKPIPHMRTGF